MPAVQLARLKKQINELTWKFTRPAEFQQHLNDLFEFYSNQVFKPGRIVPSNRRIEAFHIPPIILNQLELELEPFVQENPGAALSLADTLWEDDHLEPRLLAALLLGSVPAAFSTDIVQRLDQWTKPGTDSKSLEVLFNAGARRVRREKPGQWFELIQTWLSGGSLPKKVHAIQALIPAAQEHDFENLPIVFQVIHPLVENPPTALQTALIELLQILARRTPAETLYFLKQRLVLSTHPATSRLIRRLVPAFEPEDQARLKAFLIEQSKTREET